MSSIREPAAYLEIWRDVLAQVLGEIASTPVSCVLEKDCPADLPAPAEGDLWILVSALGSLRGEMGIRVPAGSVVRLAQFFTGETAAAVDLAVTGEHRDAVLELLRQTSGLVVTGAKTNWGEIQLHLDFTPASPSWPSSYTAWLRLDRPGEVIVEVHCSVALTAALDSEPSESSPAVPVPPLAAPTQAPSTEEAPVHLELIRDVELAVTLRFGSRRLLLREVLDLNPGSVIELDRAVHEPVDLLLDGRVIAQGEVVVVEGNYGLRVTEVAPPGA